MRHCAALSHGGLNLWRSLLCSSLRTFSASDCAEVAGGSVYACLTRGNHQASKIACLRHAPALWQMPCCGIDDVQQARRHEALLQCDVQHRTSEKSCCCHMSVCSWSVDNAVAHCCNSRYKLEGSLVDVALTGVCTLRAASMWGCGTSYDCLVAAPALSGWRGWVASVLQSCMDASH